MRSVPQRSTEIADDVLCVMTEHGEYGEIEIEALEALMMLEELSA